MNIVNICVKDLFKFVDKSAKITVSKADEIHRIPSNSL